MTADELEERAKLYRIYVGPPYYLMREAIARVRELEQLVQRLERVNKEYEIKWLRQEPDEEEKVQALEKRIAELEAKREEHTAYIDILKRHAATLEAKCERYEDSMNHMRLREDYVNGLEADKARLDWLEKHSEAVVGTGYIDGNFGRQVMRLAANTFVPATKPYASVREAIDAASI